MEFGICWYLAGYDRIEYDWGTNGGIKQDRTVWKEMKWDRREKSGRERNRIDCAIIYCYFVLEIKNLYLNEDWSRETINNGCVITILVSLYTNMLAIVLFFKTETRVNNVSLTLSTSVNFWKFGEDGSKMRPPS